MADERISDETWMLAVNALARARAAPTVPDIRGMERDALRGERGEMSPAEIRALADDAVAQAQQLSTLMTRLADLLDANPGGHRG